MQKKSVWLVLKVFVAILMLTACTGIVRGSGNLVTETRQVSNFDSIVLSGSGRVIVTQGGSESLAIETDDNIMKYVKADVEGGALKLGFKSGINIMSYSSLTFHVGVDDLTGLSISGSGNFESDSLDTSLLDATVSGSGNIRIADLKTSQVKTNISGSGEVFLVGEVANQEVNISGSGKYLAGDVCSGTVNVKISGSGDATVCATETLVSNISGSGSLNYYGKPSVNSSGSGSGRINDLGEK